eukprot:6643045-Prymnesium_polylepis.1
MRTGKRACSCAAADSASIAAAVPMMAWKSLSTSSSWRRRAPPQESRTAAWCGGSPPDECWRR